jgi:hypothetical protein
MAAPDALVNALPAEDPFDWKVASGSRATSKHFMQDPPFMQAPQMNSVVS